MTDNNDGLGETQADPEIDDEPRTNLFFSMLAVISVTIGAGMVAVPNAAYNSGIPWTIAYFTFNFVLWVYSIHWYLRWAQVTGFYSIPKIGYEVWGRFSLYFVNFLQVIGFLFLPISYFIIFGNLLRSFFMEIDWVRNNARNTIGSQWLSVVLLAIVLLPLIVKKKMAELKIAGVFLFLSVILFITLMIALRVFNSGNIQNPFPIEQRTFYRFRFDKAFISSLSTAFVAFGFQSAFFPIYNGLTKRTYRRGMKFTFLGIGFWFIIYMMVMFVSLYTFGINVHGDVLENVEEIQAWESYVLRVVFMILMATHLPFIFFVGKDSLLAIIALLVVKGDIEKEIIKNIADDEDYGRQTKQAYVDEKQKRKDKKKRKKNKKKNKKDNQEALIVEDNSSERKTSYMINRESTSSSVSSEHVAMDQPQARDYTWIVPLYEEKEEEEKSETIVSYEDAEQNISVGVDQLPRWIYYTVTFLSYGAVVAASSLIKDAEIVLKFIGSGANALLNFTLPGLFYFVIMRRYNAVEKRWKIYMALALSIYGAVMGILLTGVNIWTTISPVVRHPDDV